MKKVISTILVLSIIGLFSGCNGANTATNSKAKIGDYFPILNNTEYKYQGSGNEYATFSVFTEYTADNKIQQRTINGGSEIIKVIENKDGKLTKTYSLGETYYRQNFLDSKGVEEVLLMEPLKTGTTWTLPDKSKRTITGVDVEVTTPLSAYKAIEVTTESKTGKTVDYYAKDIGLVKTVYKTGDTEITSSLSEIKNNEPHIQKVKFFYPNFDSQKYYYLTKRVSFNTNDNVKEVLEKAYKEVITGKLGNMDINKVIINSLNFNKDKIVYIDFNSLLITQMNVGAEFETMILQSIVNTFGSYYQTDKVNLTVDNKPYSSGHIVMNPNQTFKVQLQNSFEVK